MINNTAICDSIAEGIAPNVKNTFTSAQQIVFIDRVEDYQLLANGVMPGIEVVVLESDRNGIEQITEALSQRTDFTTIHLVSHGSPGCLYLGNSSLSLDTLNQYEEDLKTWFSLSPSLPVSPSPRPPVPQSPSLLLYGCNVAAGDAGEEFIAKLHDLTGAEIAASATRTGNAALGGDWNLEVQVGKILTKTAFTPQVLADYQGILNPPISPLNLAEQSSKYSVGLKPASALLSQHLATWFSQEDFLTQAAIPFSATAGSSTWTDNALALQESILNDTYSIRLEVRSASEMEGALGAYSSTGTTNEPTIYLNGDWLETASSDSISSVLLEELGHDFDRRLNNGVDSQGDEGQLFASMVGDRVLSQEEQASIASEDDSGLLEIDGRNVPVEFATVNISNGNLNFSNRTNKVGTGTGQGNIVLYTGVYTGVDAIVTTTNVPTGITITDFDYAGTATTDQGNQTRFFSPRLQGTAAANGTGATFNIQFIEAGSYNNTSNTGTPITLQNVTLNSYDIDIRQYQTFSGFNTASLISTGGQIQYATNSASGITTFSSTSDTNLEGDVTTTQNGRVQVTYDEVSNINLNVGSNNYSLVTGLAYYFLEFGPGQPWTPTTVYVPKIDLNGTATAGLDYSNTFNQSGNAVNVADGLNADAADVDNNITRLNIAVTGSTADVGSETVTIGGQSFTLSSTTPNKTVSIGGTTFNLAYTASTRSFAITNNAGATLSMPEANLDTLLKGITYRNSSTNPTSGARTFSFTATDATGFISPTAVSTINVNKPPVIDLNGTSATGLNYSATFNQSGTPVNVASASGAAGLLADAADSEDNITRLNIAVGGIATDAATETVTIGGQSFFPNATNQSATTSVGGTNLTITYTGSTKTFAVTNSTVGNTIPEANLDTLLQGITYRNTSANPTTGARTFNFTATDAGGLSTASPAVSTINVNKPPVIDLNGTSATGLNYSATFNQSGSAVNVASASGAAGLLADAADSEDNITRLNIAVGGIATDAATETVTIGGQSFFPNATNQSATTSVGGTNLTIAYTGSTKTFAITNSTVGNTIPEANLDTLLQGITYRNTSANPTTGARTFNFTATDAGGLSTASPAVSTINVNKPPVIDLNGTSATGLNYSATFNQSGSAVNVASASGAAGLLADAADSEDNITRLNIAVGGIATDAATETVTIGGQSFFPNATNQSATTSVGGTNLTIAYTGSTKTFAITNSTVGNTIPEANLDTLLQGITYRNTSANPTTGARTFNFTATDAGGLSTASPAVSTINVNKPPVIDLNGTSATGLNYSATFNQSGSAVNVASASGAAGLLADAADSEDNITRLNIAVGGIATDAATETVTIGGQSFFPNATNQSATTSVGGTNLTIAYTGSTKTFAITNSTVGNTIPEANLDTLLQGITYRNTSANPTTGARTFNFTATDAGGLSTASPAVSTINVNKPPVIDLDGNDSSGATGANYQTTFAKTGSAVSIADRDVKITDPDNTNIASATITLTNRQTSDVLAAGTLPAGITASAYDSNTGVITLSGSASLANYQTAIRAITFDSTNISTTARKVDVVVNDGTVNSNTATTTISIFDLLKGTNSPDALTGGTGNDLIIAGKGEDTLTGGAGNDIYFFNETSEGVDTITDFAKGQDKIDISNILANEVGYTGSDPIGDGYLKLVSLGASTIVQIDFNPADAVYPKDIAFLEGVTGVTATDFII